MAFTILNLVSFILQAIIMGNWCALSNSMDFSVLNPRVAVFWQTPVETSGYFSRGGCLVLCRSLQRRVLTRVAFSR